MTWVWSWWHWLTDFLFDFAAIPWHENGLPPPPLYFVATIIHGHYSVLSVHDSERSARIKYYAWCRAYPERFTWLFRLIEMQRPTFDKE